MKLRVSLVQLRFSVIRSFWETKASFWRILSFREQAADNLNVKNQPPQLVHLLQWRVERGNTLWGDIQTGRTVYQMLHKPTSGNL